MFKKEIGEGGSTRFHCIKNDSLVNPPIWKPSSNYSWVTPTKGIGFPPKRTQDDFLK